MSDLVSLLRKIYHGLGISRLRRFVNDLFRVLVSPYYLVTVPFRRRQHQALLENCDKSQSHTYTSFYRLPLQLEALTGPVIDFLAEGGNKPIKINIFAASNGAEAYSIASELLHKRPGLEFEILASDLHDETVAIAKSGCYSMSEIVSRTHVPDAFIKRTFVKDGDKYCVRPEIKERVSFIKADLLDPGLDEKYDPADIVLVQNVMFHLNDDQARLAYDHVSQFLKPRSALFLDGMDLDMKIELTTKSELVPLDYKVSRIYDYSRRHVPNAWWKYYYGSEPYVFLAKERVRRYSTIFFNDSEQ